MARREDIEKLDVVTEYNEARPSFAYSTTKGDDPIFERFSEAEIKRVIRKVDLRLIPICGLMYCVSLLDRTNLSNANIAGYVRLEPTGEDILLNFPAAWQKSYILRQRIPTDTYVI